MTSGWSEQMTGRDLLSCTLTAATGNDDTGVSGDLWWVRAFDDGTVFMAGSDALVLRYKDGVFQRLETPGVGQNGHLRHLGDEP